MGTEDTNESIIDNPMEDPFVAETEMGTVIAGLDIGVGYKGHNEDRVVVQPEYNRYAVVDGMGGMPRGDEAAQILAEVISESTSDADLSQIQKTASERMQENDIDEGGAVYLCAAIDDGELRVWQAGDAQLIVYTPSGEIRFQTQQERTIGGVMNAVQGTDPGKTTDYPALSLQQDDRIVLATDGVWDNIAPEDFVSLTTTLSNEAVVPQVYSLIQSQIEAGGGKPDNLSLVFYHIEEL